MSVCSTLRIGYSSLRGGGGGGVHPDFFVKLDFEIAVGIKTKAMTELLRGFRTSRARGAATLLFGQFLAQFCQVT